MQIASSRFCLTLAAAFCIFLGEGRLGAQGTNTFPAAVVKQIKEMRTDVEAQIKIRVRGYGELYEVDVLLNRARYLAKEISRDEFLQTGRRLYDERLKVLERMRAAGNPPTTEDLQKLVQNVLTDFGLP